jgi:hypothetical protein
MKNMVERRTKALDDAFLFVLGFVNIIFAILQATLGGTVAVLSFMPLLISGLVYPFYTGFIRGAIQFDDVILERARGWVTFTAGVSFYFFATASRLWSPVLALTLIAVGAWLTVRTARWVDSALGFRPSYSDLGVLGATVGASVFLSMSTYFCALYTMVWLSPTRTAQPPYLQGLWPVVMPIPAFIIMERVIRRVLLDNWKLLKTEGPRASVPPFTRSLDYLISGTFECFYMGLRSDRTATATYFASFLLLYGFFSPTLIGSIVGGTGIVCWGFSCVRFFRTHMRLRRRKKAQY